MNFPATADGPSAVAATSAIGAYAAGGTTSAMGPSGTYGTGGTTSAMGHSGATSAMAHSGATSAGGTSALAGAGGGGASRGNPVTRLAKGWIDGWWAIALRGPDMVLAILCLIVGAIAIAGFFSIAAMGVGLLLLVPALWGAWLLGGAQRHLLLAFTGTDIGSPPPSTAPQWRQYLGIDQPRLRAMGWVAIKGLWGLLISAFVITAVGHSLLWMAAPVLQRQAPDGLNLFGLTIHTPIGAGLLFLAGIVLFIGLPYFARGLAGVDVTLARWLIGADPDQQLRAMTQRVETLTTTREQTVDSVEAERRRIERDLHDGPQQRLVSIAMTLGLARTQLDDDPQSARALLDEAHAASKEAIVEMRQVARGIVPPILSDRGLDAAVSALAERSPIPVTVTTRLTQRLDPTTEAIAYFCISESLTNVAKHAQATKATVDLGLARTLHGLDALAITVSDDGQGGAVIGAGTGLTGLRQRVASVDGDLHVHSPIDGGTTIAITLPLRDRRTA
ncbi:sensor histidine kinase [Ornithinimicrobium sp. Y1694]|uniref:sensor histidine kinase n=1 Tax=Ornithinimicrobium sp. Y1694 TaxID=3418590 RepID=UPI003CE6C61B